MAFVSSVKMYNSQHLNPVSDFPSPSLTFSQSHSPLINSLTHSLSCLLTRKSEKAEVESMFSLLRHTHHDIPTKRRNRPGQIRVSHWHYTRGSGCLEDGGALHCMPVDGNGGEGGVP